MHVRSWKHSSFSNPKMLPFTNMHMRPSKGLVDVVTNLLGTYLEIMRICRVQ